MILVVVVSIMYFTTLLYTLSLLIWKMTNILKYPGGTLKCGWQRGHVLINNVNQQLRPTPENKERYLFINAVLHWETFLRLSWECHMWHPLTNQVVLGLHSDT